MNKQNFVNVLGSSLLCLSLDKIKSKFISAIRLNFLTNILHNFYNNTFNYLYILLCTANIFVSHEFRIKNKNTRKRKKFTEEKFVLAFMHGTHGSKGIFWFMQRRAHTHIQNKGVFGLRNAESTLKK